MVGPLVGALLAFGGGAVLPGVWRGAAGVAYDALAPHDAVLDAVGGVARFGFAAGLERSLGGCAGFGGEARRQSFPRVGACTGGTEADEDRDGEEGEFRFHGWIWFGLVGRGVVRSSSATPPA